VFYIPNYLGHSDNYIPANPSVTPSEIVPEWYYLPFYAILRSIPNKLLGVLALACSILVLAFLPWLDTSKVRSARYRPLYRQFFWLFVISCIGLGYLGSQRPEGVYVLLARIFTIYYFAFFFIIMPLLGLIETAKPLPKSISEDVLKHKGMIAALALAIGLGSYFLNLAPASAQNADTPPRQTWSFAGPFGKFDRAQLQRGFKVYHDVCSTCHGMQLLSFRNLAEPGGPEFTPAQVAVIASEYKYKDTNDQGEEVERAGRPADPLPPPATKFPTAKPPDLSVIAKARGYEVGFPRFIIDALTQYQEEGPDYIVALMHGYENTPQGVQLAPGLLYNKYFPSHGIAMPPPLSDGRVEYTDGSPATLDQYSKDVAAFLMWAAEPHLEQRKRIGMQVFIYLIVLAGLLYLTKRKVWHELEKPAEIARGQNPRGTTV
jgi:ubiquinol-cytochrome c reductase cytochrome b/c1 subunit